MYVCVCVCVYVYIYIYIYIYILLILIYLFIFIYFIYRTVQLEEDCSIQNFVVLYNDNKDYSILFYSIHRRNLMRVAPASPTEGRDLHMGSL